MRTHKGMMAYTVTLGLVLAGAASAQQTCQENEVRLGTLGITGWSCKCTLTEGAPAERAWEFQSEPLIRSVGADGPAAGKLRRGDVITAVDGYLITTAEGGRRFAQVQPGVPVELTVRRGDEPVTVAITPGSQCMVDAPRAALAPFQPFFRLLPNLLLGRMRITPKGWLGLSLSCSWCSIDTQGRDPEWLFSEPPVIDRVEPSSPAAAAGLRAGDQLLRIGGHPITSEEGGRLFGALRPGQALNVVFERDGVTSSADVVAGTRPGDAPPDSIGTDEHPDITRFSGVVGEAFVQVTGSPVTVSHTEDEIVIRSNDITVRIRRTGGDGR